MNHIVLAGDSGYDNAAYVSGGRVWYALPL
jgi:hypothetical protein